MADYCYCNAWGTRLASRNRGQGLATDMRTGTQTRTRNQWRGLRHGLHWRGRNENENEKGGWGDCKLSMTEGRDLYSRWRRREARGGLRRPKEAGRGGRRLASARDKFPTSPSQESKQTNTDLCSAVSYYPSHRKPCLKSPCVGPWPGIPFFDTVRLGK